MATTTEGFIELRNEADIVLCRQGVRKLVQEIKFSLVDQTKMITAASELARNTVVYGGGGRVRWAIESTGTRTALRLWFEDQGPGILDVDKALTDGWTSGKGMGVGLSGSRRLVNEFAIETAVGVGTTVMIARWK